MGFELASSVAAAAYFLHALVRHASTSAPHVAKHPIRRRILDLLGRRPGTRQRDLERAIGRVRGIVQHHVNILERVGKIYSLKIGRERRYFRADSPVDAEAYATLLQQGVSEIAARILAHPGWCQIQYLDATRLRPQTFRAHINRLARVGLISAKRDKFRTRYYPTERLQAVLPKLQEQMEGDTAPNENDGGEPDPTAAT